MGKGDRSVPCLQGCRSDGDVKGQALVLICSPRYTCSGDSPFPDVGEVISGRLLSWLKDLDG